MKVFLSQNSVLILVNSADPDKMLPSSGSSLFAKVPVLFSGIQNEKGETKCPGRLPESSLDNPFSVLALFYRFKEGV